MSKVLITTPHAVSTRADGSMKKTDGTIDFENIQMFLQSKSLPQHSIAMEQVHGGNVGIVSNDSERLIPGVDALITNKKEISLAVVTADCLPILLYDPQKKVIGVIHAGSKGLLQQIIHNSVNAFKKSFASNQEDILVTIGPCIETTCYEVSQEFAEQFGQTFSSFSDIYLLENNKYFLNLRDIALQCLLEEGILKEHISVSQTCTKCSSDTLYSY